MGIVFRQSIKSTIVIFSGAVLGALVTYLSTKYLAKQEFGFTKYFTNLAVITSMFSVLGMHSVLAVFIHRYKDDDPRKPVLITLGFVSVTIVSILISLFYFILKPYILKLYQPQDMVYAQQFFYVLPFFAFLWNLIFMFENYLSSQMKVAVSVLMREVVLRVFNIALVVLFAMGFFSFYVLFLLIILSHLITVGILWVISSKTKGFFFSTDWKVFSRAEYREIFHFGWYHMLMGISLNLLGSLDSIMLGSLDSKGMKSVGEYAVAVFLMSFIQVPYRAMASSTLPDFTRTFQQNDRVKLNDLFKRAGLNILIASVAVALLILCNMPNVISIIGKSYGSITPIVFILLLGRLTDIGTGLNNEIISVSSHYKFNFYLSLFLVIMIFFFNLLLIPVMGIYGAAWGTTISLIIFNVIKAGFLWRKMKLHPFSKGTLLILVSGSAAGLAGYLLPFIVNPFIDTFVRSALIMVVYTGLLMITRPSPDLSHYLATIKKNKRLY
jgi:O-antigen/teichoic acid export membrane protein